MADGKAVLNEMWRRGTVGDVLLHAGQKKIDAMFQQLPGSVLVFNISRQWGKTFWAVLTAIVWAIRNPNSRIRIGAAFETDLAEFIEPAFEIALATCPSIFRPRYNQQKKRFLFPNGSTIKLVGLDRKPNGLRGNTIDLILLDEAGFINRLNYLHDSVIVPLTTHRPNARIVLLTTPPESPDHEFWDFVDKAKLEGCYAEFTIDENPMLSKDQVGVIESKYVGGRTSTAFQREYLCKRIVEAERAIVPEWSNEFCRAFVHDGAYPHWHKYEALDIGVQVDKTLCLFAYYNFKQARLYIEHELDISGSKTTTQLIETKLKEKELEINYVAPYRRIADNSHPLLLNDLAAHGTAFAATDKAKIHEMVGEVRVWVQAGRIAVHPRCIQLIGCLSSGIWNLQRTEFERSKVFGHYDALAALVYLVRNVDVYTNPLPDWFTNPDRMPLVKKSEPLSPLGQDMRALFSKVR